MQVEMKVITLQSPLKFHISVIQSSNQTERMNKRIIARVFVKAPKKLCIKSKICRGIYIHDEFIQRTLSTWTNLTNIMLN